MAAGARAPDGRLPAARWQARLLLVLAQISCCTADYTWTDHSAQCGRVEGDQSNMRPDHLDGLKWLYMLHVSFPLTEGAEFMGTTVKLQWPHALTIETVEPQGAVRAVAGDLAPARLAPPHLHSPQPA